MGHGNAILAGGSFRRFFANCSFIADYLCVGQATDVVVGADGHSHRRLRVIDKDHSFLLLSDRFRLDVGHHSLSVSGERLNCTVCDRSSYVGFYFSFYIDWF